MKQSLKASLDKVEMTYQDIVEISNKTLYDIVTPMDNLVKEIRAKANNLTIDDIRQYMLSLQLKIYEVSEIKEKAIFKTDCAEALRKEKYSQSFNETEGTIGAKENTAILNSSEEVVAEALYGLMASTLKTKLNELHSLRDTLQSILMSKMQEIKIINMSATNEIAPTTNGKIILNE